MKKSDAHTFGEILWFINSILYISLSLWYRDFGYFTLGVASWALSRAHEALSRLP